MPVKSAVALRRLPLDRYRRVFDAFGGLGASVCAAADPDDEIGYVFPEMVMSWWIALYAGVGMPMPMTMVADAMLEELLAEGWILDRMAQNSRFRAAWARCVDALAAASEQLGATRARVLTADEMAALRTFTGTEPDAAHDPDGRDAERASGSSDEDLRAVELTPLGVWAVHDWLAREGIDAPVYDSAADAAMDLADLMLELADQTSGSVFRRLDEWITRRGREAPGQVEALLGSTDSPAIRLLLMAMLTRLGADAVPTAERARAAGGPGGAVAALWLVGTGALDESDLRPQEAALASVDQLNLLREQGELLDAMAEHPRDEQLAMVKTVGRSGHSAALAVLDAVAADHPDKAVRRAAGKERLRLRSG